jgi:hypothetical protein
MKDAESEKACNESPVISELYSNTFVLIALKFKLLLPISCCDSFRKLE